MFTSGPQFVRMKYGVVVVTDVDIPKSHPTQQVLTDKKYFSSVSDI